MHFRRTVRLPPPSLRTRKEVLRNATKRNGGGWEYKTKEKSLMMAWTKVGGIQIPQPSSLDFPSTSQTQSLPSQKSPQNQITHLSNTRDLVIHFKASKCKRLQIKHFIS